MLLSELLLTNELEWVKFYPPIHDIFSDAYNLNKFFKLRQSDAEIKKNIPELLPVLPLSLIGYQ